MALTEDSLPMNMALDSSQQKELNETVKRLSQHGPIERAVVYVGHIPHGFYEEQMRKYFTQFGTITKLRLSMSRKTGKPKGYGFIEFANNQVAKIVASTMNNYLMFHKLLKCQLMDPDKVHPKIFKKKGVFRQPQFQRMAVTRHNRPRSIEEINQSAKVSIKKSRKLQQKLACMGINYEFDCDFEPLESKETAITSKHLKANSTKSSKGKLSKRSGVQTPQKSPGKMAKKFKANDRGMTKKDSNAQPASKKKMDVDDSAENRNQLDIENASSSGINIKRKPRRKPKNVAKNSTEEGVKLAKPSKKKRGSGKQHKAASPAEKETKMEKTASHKNKTSKENNPKKPIQQESSLNKSEEKPAAKRQKIANVTDLSSSEPAKSQEKSLELTTKKSKGKKQQGNIAPDLSSPKKPSPKKKSMAGANDDTPNNNTKSPKGFGKPGKKTLKRKAQD